MSDPTPEEIATLMARLRRLALKLLRDMDVSTVRDAATALASLQRRAETAERERDEWRAKLIGQIALATDLVNQRDDAESRPADQAKVIEAVKPLIVSISSAFENPMRCPTSAEGRAIADLLSQLAEKGGDKI